MSEGRMEGKVVVITGGASGIGKACATRFAEEGAEILISDIGAQRLESAVTDIGKSTNKRVLSYEANVCFEDQIEDMLQYAKQEFGRVDSLVAAAGVSSAAYVSGEAGDTLTRSLLDLPVEDWNRVLQINLTGVMLTDRAAAKHMIAMGNGGTIVNIASVAARIALPGSGDYCVSKAGVGMLTQVFALEMIEHNIRVNAVGPGFVETPMTKGLRDDEEGNELMHNMTPLGRLGTTLEIANTALFLASDESTYTTGQTLYPSGGMFTG